MYAQNMANLLKHIHDKGPDPNPKPSALTVKPVRAKPSLKTSSVDQGIGFRVRGLGLIVSWSMLCLDYIRIVR